MSPKCESASVPDFVYAIFHSILLMAFKFSDMATMDKTLNWLTFCDISSIFKVTGGRYVSKLIFLCNISN